MSSNIKPYKVWSTDRHVKKSVTAGNFCEFVEKGKQKLGFSGHDNVKVVLEEDGTEVDEDDYFMFLSSNTTFMMMRQEDAWRPVGAEQSSTDEPDYASGDTSGEKERVRHLISGLQNNVTRLITFSNEDLQNIVSMSPEELASLLQDSQHYARSLQEACQRNLDERMQTTEALDLLRLYHIARQKSPYIEEDQTKKRKIPKQ